MGRRRFSIIKIIRVASVVGAGLGLWLMVVLLLPITASNSQALTCLEDDAACASALAETETEVKVKTSLAVAMQNKVAMEVIPTSKGATTIGSTELAVSTNSIDGYALYMQASDGLTNTSTVHDGQVAVEKIKITEEAGTLAAMQNNRYGYYLGENVASQDTVFEALPVTNTMIKQTSTTTSRAADTSYAYGDTYALSFGVKVGTELPSGTYAGTVTVSAVANPEALRSMADLEYMQDMTSDICTNTREGYTKQLVDTRDGKSYWVAKLKDGNCWMTQNLALDITEDGLKAVDTDIEEDWNQDSEYPPVNANKVILNGTQYNTGPHSTNYWSFGETVLATPVIAQRCIEGVKTGQTIGEICETVGFVDIDESWKPTFTTQEGTWTFNDGSIYAGLIAADKKAKTYDSHYLVGNYYQWNTATASTGVAVMDKVDASASGSICPKNWKLPTSTKYSAGDFANLLSAYGLLNDFTNGYFKNDEYFLSAPPFYFNANGLVYRWGGALSSLGNTVQLYSSTVNDKDINGNDLFGGNYFDYTVGNSTRIAILIRSGGFYYGVPVRCLAR